jgi:hypothetical protein
MTPVRKTVDHGSLQRLLEAGASIDVEVVGCDDGWGVTSAAASAVRHLLVENAM